MAIKLLRIVLGLVVAAQGLSSLFPLLTSAAYKFGLIHPTSGPAALMVPLWAATPLWQLAVWLAAVLVLAVAAWRLARGRPALWLYLAALAANAGLQWLMQRSAAYHRVFGPATAPFDRDRLVVLLLVGALIWWVEQQPSKAASGQAPADV